MGPAINVAYYTLTNIDVASGYVQLPRYLAEKTEVRYVEPVRLPRVVAAPLGRSRRMDYYEPAGARLELAVLRRLLVAPREVVHLLYGEDHFNHLARVRHLPRQRRGTLVATFHQPPEVFERVLRFRDLRDRLRALDAAIVFSTDQEELLRELMEPGRVYRVRRGINAFHFRPPEHPPATEPVRVAVVGSWLRDFQTLREAIVRVAAAEPAVRFEVVAPTRELDAAPGTRVRTGISSAELLATYQSAHLSLLPLTAATANNALGEATACGLPIVATDVRGVRDHVSDAFAVLTPCGDAEAMAAAVLELVRDPLRRARMGAAAREAALRDDWPHVAWETLQVYAAAAAQPG
jgi:glycosyltransferase involved in cell wall biosynthesis